MEFGHITAHRETHRSQVGQYLPLGGYLHPFGVYDGIAKDVQGTGGSDARVELAQGTGRGVARVGKGLFPGLLLAAVELLELVNGHVGLTAHDEPRRGRPIG